MYQDNILLFDGGLENDDAVYIKGLEYINGSYHLEGKYACLTSINGKRCPDDVEMCVLTKLLNKDTVRCSLLSSKASLYGGLSVCVGAQGSCAVVDSVSKISGGIINIIIKLVVKHLKKVMYYLRLATAHLDCLILVHLQK